MKKRILVTGGTVFVSKFVATYFCENYEVYVLNRNTRQQVDKVHLICADRNSIKDTLASFNFDAIIDICAYNEKDIKNMLDSSVTFKDYILISSSAVYPETNQQPFHEEQTIGSNTIWGNYGTNKIDAETYLLSKVPNAYILRPPYLYGPMQNLYRETFIFDCAMQNRKFYIPKDGTMKLQFLHVEDLCKIIENILLKHPDTHIYNVGNYETIDINTFVELCYQVVGTKLEKRYVINHSNQRDYFCFYDYEYILDVSKQKQLLPITKDILEGLKESYLWYRKHPKDVIQKDYMRFIDAHFIDL